MVLTATWLLPVALLPIPWDAGDIYGPRPPLTSEEITAAAETKPANSDDGAKSTDKRKKPEKEEENQKEKSLFSW